MDGTGDTHARAQLTPTLHTHTHTPQGDKNVGSYNQGNCNRGDGNNVSIKAGLERERMDGERKPGCGCGFSSQPRTLTNTPPPLPPLTQGNNLAGNYLFGNGDNPCPWNN